MSNSWYKNKFGFTLAEVLITLGIIGVVAAMTMPSLINQIKDQKSISQVKKTYSILQQATNRAVADGDEIIYWGMRDDSTDSINYVYFKYKPFFNMMRECPNQPGCWAYPTKYLNGTTYWTQHSTSYYQYAFTLIDGVNVLLDIYPAAQLVSNFGMDMDYDAAVFFIDTNGSTLPNIIGRDIFAFVLTHRGLMPAGMADSSNCNPNGIGFSCVGKIVQDGWSIKY